MKRKFDPVRVDFHEDHLWVTLADGRVIQAPLSEIDWLRDATPEQRQNYTLLDSAILWDELDDGFDTEEMTRMFHVIEANVDPA